jgi:DNA-binding GntR family transcriptional regulator
MAGAMATRRHTEEVRAALLKNDERCELSAASEDADFYYYDNEVFHRAIYAAGHSAFLAEQGSALHRRLRPCRRLQLRVRNRVKVSIGEHAGIVPAILDGDEVAARQRLRDHIAVQGDRFSDLVANLNRRDGSRTAWSPQ